MSEVFVSFVVRNNIAAVVVAKEGVLKVKQVERVKDAQALDNSYLSTLYAFNLSLRVVRQFVQDNPGLREVVFETSNSTFIKWVDKQYAKDEYQELFDAAMRMLHSIPIRYSFSYCDRPRAWGFAEAGNCKVAKIGGLDI